jgi:hypothetical protein
MGRSKKPAANNKKSAANKNPPNLRKQSRTEGVLKVIEEHVAPQREFLKALRKKFFH